MINSMGMYDPIFHCISVEADSLSVFFIDTFIPVSPAGTTHVTC